MLRHPQAVEVSSNGDSERKTKNYYLAHNFAARLSVSQLVMILLPSPLGILLWLCFVCMHIIMPL